jgi:hypothetical protein
MCCGRRLRVLLANRPLLRAIDAAIGSQSWQVAILLRLNVWVPFNFQSYSFFGATDIRLMPYTITTLLGIMPFTAMYVYLGTVGRTIAFNEGFGASNIALLLFGLVATAGLIYFVGQKTKQKLQEMSATAVDGGAVNGGSARLRITPKHPSSSAIGYPHQIKFVRVSTSLLPPIVFGFSETRQGC